MHQRKDEKNSFKKTQNPEQLLDKSAILVMMEKSLDRNRRTKVERQKRCKAQACKHKLISREKERQEKQLGILS